jgi:hypothetical protein
MLMTPRLSETHTGLHPALLTWMVSVSTPIILGIEGPHISVSIIPTVEFGFAANACESSDENVDFPTPPFPESTSILCRMPDRRAVMSGMSGSGPLGAEAHIDWFGQPLHASPLPACSDSGPGQCSIEISSDCALQGKKVCTPGSGATSCGVALSGVSRADWVAAAESSRYGDISCAESLARMLEEI